MSETLLQGLTNVLDLIHDFDVNNTFLDDIEMRKLIISRAQETGNELGLGHDWESSAFTLTAGSLVDYELPTTAEYFEVLKLRIQATGREIDKVDWDTIERARDGLTSSSGNGGDPSLFALRMTGTNTIKVRIDTIPGQARAMDVLRSSLPASTYTDATVIPFGAVLLRGVEKRVAAEIIDRMDEAAMQARKLTPRTADGYRADFERAMVTEGNRLHKLKAAVVHVGNGWR